MTQKYTAAVLGAAGGIGQPLSLLLKNSEYVKELRVFDVVPVVLGVAADLSHIETGAVVKGFAGSFKDAGVQKENLLKALDGVDVVVIPAGVPRKPGMTRDDLFKINAGIVAGLIEGVAEACPEAMVCIISNPVNSTVPIAAEVLKKKGVYNDKKLFGVSTLDIVRANTFIGEALGVSPTEMDVPVIGGHSGVTILPLISQLGSDLSDEKIEALTNRIQNAGTEVVEAKAGAGSATLSMAYAGARFAISLMKGMSGVEGVKECAYVPSSIVPELSFFATTITLGPKGAEKVHDMGKLSDFEKEQLETKVYPGLKTAIQKGIEFGTSYEC